MNKNGHGYFPSLTFLLSLMVISIVLLCLRSRLNRGFKKKRKALPLVVSASIFFVAAAAPM